MSVKLINGVYEWINVWGCMLSAGAHAIKIIYGVNILRLCIYGLLEGKVTTTSCCPTSHLTFLCTPCA